MASEEASETFALIDNLLRKTVTPNHRLFAFMGVLTTFHGLLADAFEQKLIGAESKDAARLLSDRFSAYAKDPPSSFVDMLAELSDLIERAKGATELSDLQRTALAATQLYLHQMAFSPPHAPAFQPGDDIAKDLKDFSAFVTEFKKETDRGAALVGAALVDNRLERLIAAHVLNNDIANVLLLEGNAPLGTFSARIAMSFALGLITRIEYEECNIIRRVRNSFAHQLHGLTFENQQISDWCHNLVSMPYESLGGARQRFINSVITLCMVLWYRPAHAMPFKAQEREWTWHLAHGTTMARSKQSTE